MFFPGRIISSMAFLLLVGLTACSKSEESQTVPPVDSTLRSTRAFAPNGINPETLPVPFADTFVTYLIRKGANYMEGNTFPRFQEKPSGLKQYSIAVVSTLRLIQTTRLISISYTDLQIA